MTDGRSDRARRDGIGDLRPCPLTVHGPRVREAYLSLIGWGRQQLQLAIGTGRRETAVGSVDYFSICEQAIREPKMLSLERPFLSAYWARRPQYGSNIHDERRAEVRAGELFVLLRGGRHVR